MKFKVKVVYRFRPNAELYEFDSRVFAFEFAAQLFTDDVKPEDMVKYVAISPVE
jgi:hypothetical protein